MAAPLFLSGWTIGKNKFQKPVVCAKCGSRGNKIDVRPNWKEQTPQASLTGKEWRREAIPDL